MTTIAWDLFGRTPESWERVQAVLDWVQTNVAFGYQFARPTKTAFDVYTERQGVCRDFQHLAITFLRALNIPARYATGYLGDIGVTQKPRSDGLLGVARSVRRRRLVYARCPSQSASHRRLLMARGRDAVDVALTTSFGTTTLMEFSVWTDELPRPPRRKAGISPCSRPPGASSRRSRARAYRDARPDVPPAVAGACRAGRSPDRRHRRASASWTISPITRLLGRLPTGMI